MNKSDVNFRITSTENISKLFLNNGIVDFLQACIYVQNLPYRRISSNEDVALVLIEKRGTCSTKHALLARLAEENNKHDVELIMGIFLMNQDTHPILADFFKDKSYSVIPEAHCYLRYKGIRFDFTSIDGNMAKIESKIIREQRIEPHQIGEWKVKIHQDYLEKWLKRQADLNYSLSDIWNDRENCIRLLAEKS